MQVESRKTKEGRMVLSFKDRFVEPILAGTKIHTIREDKTYRWRAGCKIHAATGVRTKKYNQFFEGVCTDTQFVSIEWLGDDMSLVRIYVNGRLLTVGEKIKLAHNDGFKNLAEFLMWFNEDFSGKIIHWTDFRY